MTLPGLNPIEAPDLICIECGAKTRRKIQKHKSTGKLEKVLYYCDTEKCQYGVSITLEHKSAQGTPYEKP